MVSGFQPAHPKHGGGGAYLCRTAANARADHDALRRTHAQAPRPNAVSRSSRWRTAIGVSRAYLSALEHGKRGRPGWHLIQRIIAYFNIIWDEAEEVVRLARISHPRIVIDTSGLDPRATELANRLADDIGRLDAGSLAELLAVARRPQVEI